ncbi:dirigent protein 24-like [Nymphaea colorata]|uniref:Dirigent protein n=1 Tax=Nymphaea colorata TaxID=210225 RepID=A0A5K1D5R3_9MAGN|nr:dirigent protein 24-like [Nymphaea colorata]
MARFETTHVLVLGLVTLLALGLAPAISARTLLDDAGMLAPLSGPLLDPSTTTTTTATFPNSPTVGPAVVPLAPLSTPALEPPTTTGTATFPNPPTVGQAVVPPSGDHTLAFFMHDILGGTHATARPVTGIVNGVDANGHLAFGKSTDFFPPTGGVPLPDSNGIGSFPVTDGNVQPFLTGLGGTTAVQESGAVGGNLPFVNAGQLPIGATLGRLEFGTITVIDDELTQGHELGSPAVGRAQGFYLASSEDGSSQTMVFTAMLGSDGGAVDTISFFGVHRTAVPESHIAVIGGTGRYENAKGYATIQTLHPADTHETDGVETVLQFQVYLS